MCDFDDFENDFFDDELFNDEFETEDLLDYEDGIEKDNIQEGDQDNDFTAEDAYTLGIGMGLAYEEGRAERHQIKLLRKLDARDRHRGKDD